MLNLLQELQVALSDVFFDSAVALNIERLSVDNQVVAFGVVLPLALERHPACLKVIHLDSTCLLGAWDI